MHFSQVTPITALNWIIRLLLSSSWLVLLMTSIIYYRPASASYIDNVDPEVDWYSKEYKKPNRNKNFECSCGLIASPGKGDPYPWQVIIYATKTSSPTFDTLPDRICSGTIINDRTVLTTASCLMDLPPGVPPKRTKEGKKGVADITWFFQDKFKYFYKNIVVARLTSTKTLMKDIKPDQILEVERYSFHLLYAFQKLIRRKHDADIMMLHLKTKLDLSTTAIVPLCLPTQYLDDKHLRGMKGHSAGWKAYLEQRNPGVTPPLFDVVFEFVRMSKRKFVERAYCGVGANAMSFLVADTFFCSKAPSIFETHDVHMDGAPIMIRSTMNPKQFVVVGLLVSMFYRNYDINPATILDTNVSGFLDTIDKLSGEEARWCKHEPNDKYEKNDDESAGKLKFSYSDLEQEWKMATSSVRKNHMFPDSVCKCGILNSKSYGRIQGGEDAEPYEYGWQVMLVRTSEKGEKSLCGGTIVNDLVILTAGHCVRSMVVNDKKDTLIGALSEPKNISVRMMRYSGVYYKDEMSQELEVSQIFVHPKFMGSLVENAIYDIALLILGDRIDFNSLKRWVSPVCLPENGENLDLDGRHALTIGFGRTKVGESQAAKLANFLKKIWVNILTKRNCMENWYEGINTLERRTTTRFANKQKHLNLMNRVCAGTENTYGNYQDPLNGDSGGPLMIPMKRGQPQGTPSPVWPQFGSFSHASTFIPKDEGGFKDNPYIQVGVTSIVNVPLLEALDKVGLQAPSVVMYISVQDMLHYIDYHSLVVGARWCPRG